MTTCRICGSSTKIHGKAKILSKYVIAYFHCDTCGFLQTEDPYWLNEAYCSSIAASDTGGLLRSLVLAERASILLYFFFDRNARFLDYAGGHGVFTRRMRDIGFDYYWQDLHTQNLLAQGFEFRDDSGPVELITSFESFEHFADPLSEIETMLSLSKNILFTTEILPDPLPQPADWYYFGLEHGQHISFYAERTLEYIAGKYGLHYYSLAPLHMLTAGRLHVRTAKLLLELRRFGLSLYVRKTMQSRTAADSIILRDKAAFNIDNGTAGGEDDSLKEARRNG